MASGFLGCGLEELGGAIEDFPVDVLAGPDVGNGGNFTHTTFDFGLLAGADKFYLHVFAGKPFSDANVVMYNFGSGCSSASGLRCESHAGDAWNGGGDEPQCYVETALGCDFRWMFAGTDRARRGPFSGVRVGEASHPGPAGSRRTARKRRQALVQAVKDLGPKQLRSLLGPLLRDLLRNQGAKADGEHRNSQDLWAAGCDAWSTAAEARWAKHWQHGWKGWDGAESAEACAQSSWGWEAEAFDASWDGWWDAPATAGAQVGQAVSYYGSAAAPAASWTSSWDDWDCAAPRRRWADLHDEEGEGDSAVDLGSTPVRRVSLAPEPAVVSVNLATSTTSRWKDKKHKQRPAPDGVTPPWALDQKAWTADGPIGFATSASAFAKALDESQGVAWVVLAEDADEAEEVFDLFTSDQDDDHTTDMSLLFPVMGDSSTLPAWAAQARMVSVPGRSAGKLGTRKCWMVVGGTAPPTLTTRCPEAFVASRSPKTVSALRASTTVVRVTFDRAFGEDTWSEVVKQPSQHARIWAGAAGVNQATIVDTFSFGKSQSRVTGLLRLRSLEAALKLWKASGQTGHGTRWFVDLLGAARDHPSASELGVLWIPWQTGESYDAYATRVAGQSKLGIVLGRGLGVRLKLSDPSFVRQPSVWRLRAVPSHFLMQDLTELLLAMGFEGAVVLSRHRNRRHFDWCFKATRRDQLQVVTQVVQWNPDCADTSEVTAIKEQARRGNRSHPTERLTEPRTITFEAPERSGSSGPGLRRRASLGDFANEALPTSRAARKRSTGAATSPASTPGGPSATGVHRDVSGEAPDSTERPGPSIKRPAEDAAVAVDDEGDGGSAWRLNAPLIENEGGGNCLYLALAACETGSKPRTHRQIRRWIGQLLLYHEAECKDQWQRGGCFNALGRTNAGTWSDFLAEQAQNTSWGGALEFDIFCRGLDMRGWIIDDAGTVFAFHPDGSKGFLTLHYDRDRQHYRAFTEVIEPQVQARHRDSGASMFTPDLLLRGGGRSDISGRRRMVLGRGRPPVLSDCTGDSVTSTRTDAGRIGRGAHAECASDHARGCGDAHAPRAGLPGRKRLTLSDCASSVEGLGGDALTDCASATSSLTRVAKRMRKDYAGSCAAGAQGSGPSNGASGASAVVPSPPNKQDSAGSVSADVTSPPNKRCPCFPSLSDCASVPGTFASEVEKSAYAALCEVVFDRELLDAPPKLAAGVVASLQGQPLSVGQRRCVIDQVVAEMQELNGHEAADPWTVTQFQTIMGALRDACAVHCGAAPVLKGGKASHWHAPSRAETKTLRADSGGPSALDAGYSDALVCRRTVLPTRRRLRGKTAWVTLAGAAAPSRAQDLPDDSEAGGDVVDAAGPPSSALKAYRARGTRFAFKMGFFCVECPYCDSPVTATAANRVAQARWDHINRCHPGMPQVGYRCHRPSLCVYKGADRDAMWWTCPVARCRQAIAKHEAANFSSRTLRTAIADHRRDRHPDVDDAAWRVLRTKQGYEAPVVRQKCRIALLNASAAGGSVEMRRLGYSMLLLPTLVTCRRQRHKRLSLKRFWQCEKCRTMLPSVPAAKQHRCRYTVARAKPGLRKAVERAQRWAQHHEHELEPRLLEDIFHGAFSALDREGHS